ncbi:MAG: hypothetical protein WCB11_12340 [Terriglobales bacterium]
MKTETARSRKSGVRRCLRRCEKNTPRGDATGRPIDRLPYFRIKKNVADQLHGVVPVEDKRTGYSAFEIDDLLLGCFDDLGWYHKRGLIDTETIKHAFGYYICESYENDQVKRYLADDDNKGRYIDFRHLYDELCKTV